MRQNKLEHLTLKPRLLFVIKPEPTRVKLLSGALLALLTNIRSDWKSLLGPNTPAYLALSSVTKKKVFKH